MNLLYIDPGTGSMLFTILFGAVATLYFVGKTAFIRLKTLLAGGRAGQAHPEEALVIFSEGGRYWPVFEPIVLELERRGLKASFLTSDKADPALGRPDGSSVKARYIGSGNMAYARLNMLEADTVLMTTPGLDVYQLKRSRKVRRYVHILHAVDDASSYRLFGLDYFDAVLLTGEHQKASIRRLEELRNLLAKDLEVVGCTYLDGYSSKLDEISRSVKREPGTTVLVAPSWGPSGLLSRYGMELLGPLARSGLRLIVRPHPQSLETETAVVDGLRAALAAYPNVSWDTEHENLKALARADILISDFSGVAFDYAFLFGGPILYALADFDKRLYDAGDLEGEPWKFQVIRELGVELKPGQFNDLPSLIPTLVGDTARASRIAEIKNTAWAHRGHAARATVDYLASTMERDGAPARPVLHIVTNADLGGAPRVVTELANAAAGAGSPVAVAAMATGPMWDALAPSVQRFPLRFMKRQIRPWSDLACLFELRALIRKLNPRVVHTHSSKAGVLGRLAAPKSLRGALVYTVHGFDTIRKAHRLFLPLERLLAKRTGAIVPVSAYDRDNLVAEKVDGRLELIPNGVSDRRGRVGSDHEALASLRAARKAGRRVVLSVARLASPKRFDIFAQAAGMCGDGVEFFWIGNPQDRAELERTFGQLPTTLHLLGELPEAGDYINECDVFVLVSDYEGLPMSVLEALACGKPVVASGVGGIPEALEGGAGIVVENDAGTVAEALRGLLASQERCAALATAARRRYEERYSVNAMAASYDHLYKELTT